MTLQDNEQRLSFLRKVIAKEIQLLQYASSRLFDHHFSKTFPFSASHLTEKLEDPDFALVLEAYTSRFCHLQDTVGDKLLPAWLYAQGEIPKTAMDNLTYIERLGLLDSAQEWIEIRLLRNQMVHEYIESPERLFEALQLAHNYELQIIHLAQKLS